MFSNTIFDNTQSVRQGYLFQYITILFPLNKETELTIQLYDKIARMMSDDGSMWDIGLE